MTTLHVEYARKLGLLTGDAFEREVVVAFQQTHLGFQRVPDKPHGDGGLDGLSHSFTRGYCCYGLELQPSPGTLAAALRKKIARKFKDDLMRLFELKLVKKKLVHAPNEVLPKVLGASLSSLKLDVIRLIVNVFEDNRLIGDLRTTFDALRNASKKRYVAAQCELTIWGPEDVANNTSVSEQSLVRLDHPGLFEAIKVAEEQAKTHEPPGQEKFNKKFDDLLAPTLDAEERQSVEDLRPTFKKAWSTSLLLNQQVASSLPALHEEFDRMRKTAARDARLASSKPGVDPFTLIEDAQRRLHELMGSLVNGGLPSTTRDQLAEAETGRLIGECPLRWRKPA